MKRVFGVFSGLVVIAGLAWLWMGTPVAPHSPSSEPRHTAEQGIKDLAQSHASAQAGRLGPRLRFDVKGDEGGATIRVGAPAIYPPLEGIAMSGEFPIISTVDGIELREAEVQIITPSRGFWGFVDLSDGAKVSLRPLADFKVCVVGTSGPIENAQVRAGLARVGFIAESLTTDNRGCAAFRMPKGHYTFTVKAPGYLTRSVIAEGDVELSLATSVRVAGDVRNTDGLAVSGAVVAAIQNGQTVAITATDEAGSYELMELPAEVTSLFVFADGYAGEQTIAFEPNSVERRDVTLVRGISMVVRVTSQAGDPISGAVVYLENEQATQAFVTDPAGRVRIDSAPRKASVFATFGRYRSAQRAVAEDLALVLGADLPKPMLIRVIGADVASVLAESDESGACKVSGSGRDWRIDACIAGTGRLVVTTAEGPYTWTGRLVDGLEIEVPKVRQTTIQIEGDWPVARTRAYVVEGGVRVRHDIVFDQITVRSREAQFDLVLDAEGESITLPIQAGGDVSIRPRLSPRRPLRVVDERNAPVTGAWIGVVSGQGVIKTSTSAGILPLSMRIPDGAQVIAVSPRRGEGILMDGQLIKLTDPVGTHGVVSLADVEKLLGAELVADGAGRKVDAKLGTRANNAGIKRGAWYVFASRNAGGAVIVVFQDNTYKTFRFEEL